MSVTLRHRTSQNVTRTSADIRGHLRTQAAFSCNSTAVFDIAPVRGLQGKGARERIFARRAHIEVSLGGRTSTGQANTFVGRPCQRQAIPRSVALDANGHQGRIRVRLLGARSQSKPGPKGARDDRGAIEASKVGAKSTRSIAMSAPEATAGSDEHTESRGHGTTPATCWGQSSYALCSGFTNEHSGRKIEVLVPAGERVRVVERSR